MLSILARAGAVSFSIAVSAMLSDQSKMVLAGSGRWLANASFRKLLEAVAAAPLVMSAPALAQTDSVLIAPELPEDFDRGQNVSVREMSQPGYDPLGIQIGSWQLFPKVEYDVGITDNAYRTSTGEIAAGYLTLSPSIRVSARTYPYRFDLDARAAFQRYIGESPRNNDTWSVRPSAQVSLDDNITIFGDFRAARLAENPFSGELSSELSAYSEYMNFYGRLRGEYEAGQFRSTVALERSSFNFLSIQSVTGDLIAQDERDRTVTRSTAQLEYATSPRLAVFGLLSVTDTDYDQTLGPGLANRDSNTTRLSVGVTFDISRLLRGTVGMGHLWRDFDSELYPEVTGVSIESKVEYFPTPITTLTLELRRTLRASSLGASMPFFENRAKLKVDHSFLRNLLLTSGIEFGIQNYIGADTEANLFGVSGGAEYGISELFGLTGSAGYSDRVRTDSSGEIEFDEFRIQIGIVFHR